MIVEKNAMPTQHPITDSTMFAIASQYAACASPCCDGSRRFSP